jgi:hypothetical protein
MLRDLFAITGADIDVGEGAMGGAEVDADGEPGLAHSSTSAGATMRRSWLPASLGRRVSLTRQPRWVMLPLNGGWPTTLPVTRIAAASKPAGSVTRLPSASCAPGRW